MARLLSFNPIKINPHPFGHFPDNAVFHSNSTMLAWGPGTSLRGQKGIT